MKKTCYPLLLIALLANSACSSLNQLDALSMANVPIVKFGETAQVKANEFILHYPAGTPLPVMAAVRGDLLEKTDQANLTVTLKKDIYLYRNWVSFDGKTWLDGEKTINSQFKIDLPGLKDGQNVGDLSAEFNLK